MGEPLVIHRSRHSAPVLEATLRVTEIFHSLQGETSRVGLPTVFVRLTGCPLRCGYCDTAYTERYLINRIRETFGFEEVPIRLSSGTRGTRSTASQPEP